MDGTHDAERYETVIIGGGQAGLATGYHLARLGRSFVILEADRRVGDVWRRRWDSLHLFTPARHDGLPGWKFPAKGWSFPSRDDMADYLEAYAARFDLPVRAGMPVDGVVGDGDGGYVVTAAGHRFEADNVVVATGAYQVPTIPALAPQLDPGIVQLHSSDYRDPSQLRDGGVLVVGAGNSGAEIALESAGAHRVWLSGPEVGALPFRMGGLPSRLLLERLVLRVLFHRVLTVKTPMGRRMRTQRASRGTPLIRIRPREIPPPASSGWPGSPASGTGCRCWRTAASSRWPTSSGPPGSTTTSRGSTSPAWATASRPTGAGWSTASRGCTWSACTSCTPCRRR
jgi:putative flavoprotein involved in K+ transport